jgi:hypothetical protein
MGTALLVPVCLTLVAMALGGAAFLAARKPPRARAVGLLVGIALALLLVLGARSFVIEDICLDSGGAWNAATSACDCDGGASRPLRCDPRTVTPMGR